MGQEIVSSRIADSLIKIAEIKTVDELKNAVKEVNDIKTLLELADKFNKESVKYAQLEAAVLIKAAELIDETGEAVFRKNSTEYSIAKWLKGLSLEKRDFFIAQCSDGVTLRHIYLTEIKPDEVNKKRIRQVEEEYIEAILSYEANGIVRIPSFKTGNSSFDFGQAHYREGQKRRMRSELLSAGAVALGDGSRVYIDPSKLTDIADIKRVLDTRKKSILITAENLVSLMRNERWPFELFDDMAGWCRHELPDVFLKPWYQLRRYKGVDNEVL